MTAQAVFEEIKEYLDLDSGVDVSRQGDILPV